MAPIRGVKSIASATTETTKAPTGKKKKAAGDKNSLLAKPADPALIRSALEFLERDTMGATWQEALKDEFKKPYFLEVSSNIRPGALILSRIIVEGILDI
ncbi:hypothetical protein HWV62_23298 [Athelia sp. TMB]|nr:hypothetical protein HWV62_23298 [Athelia sp. TMB]